MCPHTYMRAGSECSSTIRQLCDKSPIRLRATHDFINPSIPGLPFLLFLSQFPFPGSLISGTCNGCAGTLPEEGRGPSNSAESGTPSITLLIALHSPPPHSTSQHDVIYTVNTTRPLRQYERIHSLAGLLSDQPIFSPAAVHTTNFPKGGLPPLPSNDLRYIYRSQQILRGNPAITRTRTPRRIRARHSPSSAQQRSPSSLRHPPTLLTLDGF